MREYLDRPGVRERTNRLRNERRKKLYAENPEARANWLRKTRHQQALRREILHWLKDQPCWDCGRRFRPECMDFDHRPGTKSFNVGNLRTINPEIIQEEVVKCELVCSNCHRTRTVGRMRRNGVV